MELSDLLAFARKWAWLIVITTLLFAAGSYAYSLQITPTYLAETTIIVGQQQSGSGFTQGDLSPAGGNLAQAYASLVSEPAVLQATADAIGWKGGWQELYYRVSGSASGSQLIRISGTSSDRVEAKKIADEMARQLISKSPISQQQEQAEGQREFITRQQKILQTQIEAAQTKLAELNSEATIENDAGKLADLNDRISALQAKVDAWQKNYADLTALLNAGSDKYLTILAPAKLPTEPVSPNIPRNVLMVALAGAVIAGVIAYVLDYFDKTIKSKEDVERELELSTLGAITNITDVKEPGDTLITQKHPRSPISEAFRVLRTNLRFSGIENPNGALLVTSAGPGEGKTTTAANLAVTLAQMGKRVVLMDADLRRPSIHKLFGFSNTLGLTNLFLDDAPQIDAVLHATEIPGLRVLPSGPIPPNPAEMLDSKLMSDILSALRDESDMVVIDSPPALAVADASIIGSRCSGAILVIETGKTRTEVVQRAVETLSQTNVKLVGAVLNKLSHKRASGYYYYYYYYSNEDGKRQRKHRKPS